MLISLGTGSKSIPYRESKLTKALFNTLQPFSHVVIISHLHPGEANYEESLAALQFADRVRNVDIGKRILNLQQNKGVVSVESVMSNLEGGLNNDRIFKKMTSEITELNNKIENTKKVNIVV